MASAGMDTSEKQLSLDTVVQQIDEISSLPHIAVRVLSVANDPNSGAADLRDLLETDASLSARVLRVVNSSAYALRTKITNLQQSIAYLGLKQVRNLAMTASVSELFAQNDSFGTYSRSALWRHLVSVGICSRMIAEHLGFANSEDVFLAGLLHDIGIILEDQSVHEEFSRVIETLEEGKTLSSTEMQHIGFDHTQLGEKVGELWGFPEGVDVTVRYHHASANYRGPHIATLQCVEVANLLCTLKGITSVGMKLVRPSTATLKKLSLSKQDLKIISDKLDEEIEANAALFQV
ncbi:MAG: HDOD domain-containing protein [Pirellulales bacterium]|nr:HDOD domain-containing protein [Pirellulales bacterium]